MEGKEKPASHNCLPQAVPPSPTHSLQECLSTPFWQDPATGQEELHYTGQVLRKEWQEQSLACHVFRWTTRASTSAAVEEEKMEGGENTEKGGEGRQLLLCATCSGCVFQV